MSNGKIPDGYEERTNEFPEVWKPGIGEVLQGRILQYKEGVKVDTEKGVSDIAIVHAPNGNSYSVFISAGLAGKITRADIGKLCYITRTEDEDRGKPSAMKTYAVGIKK